MRRADVEGVGGSVAVFALTLDAGFAAGFEVGFVFKRDVLVTELADVGVFRQADDGARFWFRCWLWFRLRPGSGLLRDDEVAFFVASIPSTHGVFARFGEWETNSEAGEQEAGKAQPREACDSARRRRLCAVCRHKIRLEYL